MTRYKAAIGNDEHLMLLEIPCELHDMLCDRLLAYIKGFGNSPRQLIRRYLLLQLTPDEKPNLIDLAVVTRADPQQNAMRLDLSPDDVRLAA